MAKRTRPGLKADQQTSRRKKMRRRQPLPLPQRPSAAASALAGPAAPAGSLGQPAPPNVVPFPRPSAPRAAPQDVTQLVTKDAAYAFKELRRIALTAGTIIVFLIVLTIFLR